MRSAFGKNLRMFCLIAGTSIFLAGGAYAQSTDNSPQQRYDAALEAVMQDMANPEKSFRLVEAATSLGDLRGAISALERILLINPNLANIKLELGVLYLRSGSPDLAKTFIQQALDSEDVPELVRFRAEQFLARAEAGASRFSFNGTLFAAGRYETNATAAPSSGRISFIPPGSGNEQVGELQDDDTENEDGSIVFAARGQGFFDLGTQAGHEIEGNAFYFGSRYFEETQINIDAFDLNLGPRFYVGRILAPDFSIRPYAIYTHIRKDSEGFQDDLGVGLNFRKFFSPQVLFDMRNEYRNRSFQTTDEDPNNNDRDGYLVTIEARLSWEVQPGRVLTGRLFGQRNDADEGFESYYEGGIALSILQYYAAPFGMTSLPWNSSLSGQYRRTEYDDPDPTISFDEQDDDRYEVSFVTNIPITRTVNVVTNISYTENQSNYDTSDFDNFLVSLGASGLTPTLVSLG